MVLTMRRMAVANMVLVVLLAAKNTPLAFITRFSYERLNILHQVAGYTTLALVIIHASCYSSHFVEDGNPERLTTLEETFGMVAGLSFLFLGISGGIIKRWWYELFYYTHICFWIVAIVSLGLHQPEMSKKVLIGTSIGGGIWVIDRLIRLARLLIYTTNNRVKVTPLPNGGTRLSLAKAPLGAVSGQHCFLWIPGIRFFETHPFTIASMDSPEFVIASYDGFTQDLHNFAVEHPGTALKASAEGAYGVFPDPKGYHTSIFVAGGSGASFTFGMALNMLRKTNRRTRRVVFVWVVRNEGECKHFFF